MSPAAGLGQRRKLRPSRWATPCPQTRGMNGPPAPRRRREHQSPAGSGAARTEGKEGGEARERVSARERPGKRRRNWARRAAASPRASCGSGSSEGGGAAAPPAARDRRVEVRSSRGTAAVWGSPSSSRVANLKLSLPEPPARAAECCSSRRFGEAGGRETGERRSRRPGWERGRRASGVCPGARQAAAAPGKVISALRGVAPRAAAAQVPPGRAWVPARGPGAKPGPSGRDGGAPSGAGSRLGMEGGAEMVKWRGAGRSAREPRGAGAVRLAAPARALFAVAVSREIWGVL